MSCTSPWSARFIVLRQQLENTVNRAAWLEDAAARRR